MHYFVYSALKWFSWWDVMLVSNRTWVRFPGPSPYFPIFLPNVFPYSICSWDLSYDHRPCLPRVQWSQSKGPDWKNTMDSSQTCHMLPEKSQIRPWNLGPTMPITPPIGDRTPQGLLFLSYFSFFYLIQLFPLLINFFNLIIFIKI